MKIIIAALTGAALVAPTVAANAAPAGAQPALRRLPCHASVSNSRPKDYSDVYVYVKTARGAHVHTVAHYKTTDTPHSRRANRQGRATIDYYISSATPGYRVKVSVAVKKGRRHGSCSTSFTPKS